VFAVDRKQRDAATGHRGHNEFSGGDQDLFIGESDILALLDRSIGSRQADDPDGGRNNGFGIGMRRDALDALGSGENLDRTADAVLVKEGTELVSRFFARNGRKSRSVTGDLFGQESNV
jgi:hypothetical protein